MATVGRIQPGDADVLRQVRLAALLDAPSAFGATSAEESARSPKEWAERARRGAAGDSHVEIAHLTATLGVSASLTCRHRPRDRA